MKKLLRLLFILVLLGLGFLYIVKNPEAGISQTILKAIGLERLLVSDEEVVLGTGQFTLDTIGATLTLPVGWTIELPPEQMSNLIYTRIATPYKDNEGYAVFIEASLTENTDTKEEIIKTYNLTGLENGQIFTIDCAGVTPSACIGITNSDKVYTLGLSAGSLQKLASDRPSTMTIPNFTQVNSGILLMMGSVVVISMTGEIAAPIQTGELVATTEITTDQGYIKEAYIAGGKKYLKIDYTEDGPQGPGGAPEIINNNPLIRIFEVADTATFEVLKNDATEGPKPVSVLRDEFTDRVNKDRKTLNPTPEQPTYYGSANISIVKIDHDSSKIYKAIETYRP